MYCVQAMMVMKNRVGVMLDVGNAGFVFYSFILATASNI